VRLQNVTPPVFTMTGILNNTTTITGLAPIGLPPFSVSQFLPYVGQPVSGANIPTGTTVLSVTSSTQLTLSQAATGAGLTTLTFGVEPVTLAEALLHCRFAIPATDPIYASETALVQSLIVAARRYAETFLKSALMTQTWMLYLDSFPAAGGYYSRPVREIWPSYGSLPFGFGFWPGMVPNSTGVIPIPLPPIQQIISVSYTTFAGTTVIVPPANYNVSYGTPGRSQPQFSMVWPISRPTIDSVQITYQCGYGPLESHIDPAIQTAIKMLVSSWYENREHVQPGGFVCVPDTVNALLGTAEAGIYG